MFTLVFGRLQGRYKGDWFGCRDYLVHLAGGGKRLSGMGGYPGIAHLAQAPGGAAAGRAEQPDLCGRNNGIYHANGVIGR